MTKLHLIFHITKHFAPVSIHFVVTLQAVNPLNMIRLYLTRHGETLENASGTLQGHLPGHLSPKGIEQANALSAQLADTHFDAVISSPLQRALDTARILNEPHGLDIVTTPLLSERDWGSFTGMKVADIRTSPDNFPPDVESPSSLQLRARNFLKFLLDHFDGKTVLAVGHGYFDRCIAAEICHKTPRDIPHWGNTETRTFIVSHQTSSSASFADDEASAD
ncbi:MAG TPA: histidine phosphatase family protein [Prevotellaceae bacterium]|nr:histidine phosphatase family protein [Prevotellaceae bacterium]